MDPISIIGLVASVFQLVEASKKVHDVARTFKNGEVELADLANDLSIFTEALIGFDRVLRSKHTLHRVSGPVLEDMIGHSKHLIQELETELAYIGNSSYSTVRRAKWIQHRSSVNKLHTKLKEKTAMLQTFLSIAHVESFMAISSQFPEFMLSTPPETAGTNSSEVEVNVPTSSSSTLLKVPTMAMRPRKNSNSSNTSFSSSLSTLEIPTAGMRPRKNSNSSTITFSTASDSASMLEQTCSFSTASSMANSTVSWSSTSSCGPDALDSADTENGIALSSKKLSIPEHMFVVRRSCHYNCHCQCHKDPTVRPRRHRLMGSQGSFKKGKARCTNSACMGNETLEDASEEYSRSFRKVLSNIVSAKSVDVRYDLKTFRTVPEWSEAMSSIKHGNLESLKGSIQSGEATIWDVAPDGWSLLHAAAYHRQVEIVEYLLELGASNQTGDIGARTPADFAVLKSIGKDATESEKRFVDLFGEKDDVLADFEFTPIHIAVLDLYSHDDRERPSLQELIELTDEANNAPAGTDWAEWKLKYQGRSPLFDAILEYFRASAFELSQGTKIIHNLIDQKDKKYHWTPLHWAASSGRVREMHILINHGADPVLLSNLGANIIHAAVESKSDSGLIAALKIWKRCPELEINQVNIWGETALHVASCISASCVKLLLDAGADPRVQDENGQVALHFAGLSAQSAERLKVVNVLCNAEATTHINITDYNGRPPVFDFLDDANCVEVLLRHGANVEVTDSLGQNAFHHACIQGQDDSLQVMLQLSDYSEATAARNNNGNTPLIEALSNSNIECAATLLKLEDIGPQIGQDGWAPIHYAAKIGDAELLHAICNHSSFKKLAKTLDGKRASMVAMEAGTWHGKIKELIREYDYVELEDLST